MTNIFIVIRYFLNLILLFNNLKKIIEETINIKNIYFFKQRNTLIEKERNSCK